MPQPNQFHFRFAVGSSTLPRSSLWRVWTSKPPKSDVYIAVRHLAGILKISLHESGVWRAAFTSQFAERRFDRDPTESRLIERWKRPGDLSPGVCLAFRIIVPTTELRMATVLPQDTNKIRWIPSPGRSNLTEFLVFFTTSQTKVTGWPGKRAMATHFLASHILPSGEILWLVYSYNPVSSEFMKWMSSIKRTTLTRMPKYMNIKQAITAKSPKMIVGGNNDDGSRYYLELSVSRSQTLIMSVIALFRVLQMLIRRKLINS